MFTVEDITVSSFQPDLLNRRLAIGYSNGVIKVVATSTGSVLTEVDPDLVERGCNWVIFAKLQKSKFIVAANGAKQIVLFDDLTGNRVQKYRTLAGHREQISRIVNLKGQFILSIGMGRELMLWDGKKTMPHTIFQLGSDPSTACDIVSEDNFLVGDISGLVHIMTIKSARPLASVDPFGMRGSVPITTVAASTSSALIAVGNRLGYVRLISIEDEISLVPKHLFRAHPAAIEQISISDKYRFVVTAGRDQEVRFWFIAPFAYMGELGKHRKWQIDDPSTWPKAPCDVDPGDFGPSEAAEENRLELERSQSDRGHLVGPLPDDHSHHATYQPVTSSVLSVPTMASTFRELEELCRIGRKHARMAAAFARAPLKPQTADECQTSYDALISENHLDTNQALLRRLRSLKFEKAHTTTT
jgi:WD40 repeat protein